MNRNLMELAKQEFREIVNSYLVPLFDARGRLKIREIASNNTEFVSYSQDEKGQGILKIFPCISNGTSKSPFYCEVGTYSSLTIKRRLASILREILKVSEYNCFNNMIHKLWNKDM